MKSWRDLGIMRYMTFFAAKSHGLPWFLSNCPDDEDGGPTF